MPSCFGADDVMLVATEIVVLTDMVIDFGFVFDVAFTIALLTDLSNDF